MRVMGDNPKGFDVEYIRVSKILGGSLYDSEVLSGMMIERAPLTSFQRVEKLLELKISNEEVIYNL